MFDHYPFRRRGSESIATQAIGRDA